MKYTPYYTNKIKRQLKLLKKRGYNMALFKEVVEMLLDEQIITAAFFRRQVDDNSI